MPDRIVAGPDTSGEPMTGFVAATANVRETLPRPDARRALRAVLEEGPDVIALQEWHPTRWPLLREWGSIRCVPGGVGVPASGADARFRWFPALAGGCVVGVDGDRFEVVGSGLYRLSWPGRADRGDGALGLEAPRLAVVLRSRDCLAGGLVAFVAFHLVHGVQAQGRYRPDRPGLVARHRSEVARLGDLVEGLRTGGYRVVALGDSNFHGLRIPGLVPAWRGRPTGDGTLGGRRVDDVHGWSAPVSVTTVVTPSDHRAVVVRY